MTEKARNQDTKAPAPAAPAEPQRAEERIPDVDSDARANETPIERARRLGQGDDVNPNIPTGQTPEDTAARLPEPNSNEELRIAGTKRGEADDDALRGQRGDQRGQTSR
jgi:hypothetical protein